MSNNDLEIMSSTKPYLLRAFYEWIVDNDKTPFLVLNAEFPGVRVPQKYVENGRIILNVAAKAVQNLMLENNRVEFQTCFDGVATRILAPLGAVMAIYARENGKGMIFSDEDEGIDQEDMTMMQFDEPEVPKPADKNKSIDDSASKSKPKRPDYLHIIK